MAKKSDKKEAKEVNSSVMMQVKILKHRTKVGGVICAEGATLNLPQEQADALVSAELAEIIGIN